MALPGVTVTTTPNGSGRPAGTPPAVVMKPAAEVSVATDALEVLASSNAQGIIEEVDAILTGAGLGGGEGGGSTALPPVYVSATRDLVADDAHRYVITTVDLTIPADLETDFDLGDTFSVLADAAGVTVGAHPVPDGVLRRFAILDFGAGATFVAVDRPYVILTSPDGTDWLVEVNDTGNLITTEVV